MKNPSLVLTIVGIALASTVHAQTVSSKTGSFSETATWGGLAVPTGAFTISAGNEVTAGSGVNWASSANISVFGTLNVNAGASIVQASTARINNSSTINTGIVNINGGTFSVGREAYSTGGALTYNLSSGSLSFTASTNALSNNTKLNVSGGVFSTATINTYTTTKFGITGGTSIFLAGLNVWGNSAGYCTWNGGTIATNTAATSQFSNNTSAMGWFVGSFTSDADNVWDLSSKTSKQTFLYNKTNEAFTATLGTIQFDIYSSTANDCDQISLTGGASSKLSLSNGVHLDIDDVNLTGSVSDYIGKTYQLFNFNGGYSGIAAAVDPTIWTLNGQDYNVSFTNNLATNGSITIDAMNAIVVPEPSTFVLVGLGLTGCMALRRRRIA